MLPEHSQHRRWATNKLKKVLEEYEVQPILFVGSGLSIRYFDGPSWDELLEHLGEECPNIEKPLNFYKQRFDDDPYRIAEEFAQEYMGWAWDVQDEGIFPTRLYEQSDDGEIFLKHEIAEFLKEKQPDSIEEIEDRHKEEIELIKEIGPHAIITTNYDQLLEQIFADYDPIIGEDVYGVNYASMGEIFKIHGCVSAPEEIIITKSDYKDFIKKKKYMSAKLLTYFAEHPVIVLGYGAEDPNVRQIMSDIDIILADEENDLIENIFHVGYSPGITEGDDFSRYETIPTEDGRVRVNSISEEDYKWIYKAAGHDSELTGVKVKYLRKLLSNTYEIVSEDAPRKQVQVEILKNASDEEELPKLFGIAPMDEASETVDVMRRLLSNEGGESVGDLDSLDDRLSFATFDYLTNKDTLSSRDTVLEFRRGRSEFELNEQRRALLFKSSIRHRLHGTDWLIGYEGNLDELLSETLEQTDRVHSIARLEYVLYLFKKESLLRQIEQNYTSNELDTEELIETADSPLSSRVSKYYSNDRISFTEDSITVQELFGDNDRVEELLDEATELLLSDATDAQKGTYAVDFRKLELLKLANSIRGNGLQRWVGENEEGEES